MKRIAAVLVVSSMALQPVKAVAEQNNGLGLILGGIIAGAIISESQKNRTQKSGRVNKTSTMSAETRADNKRVQEALNYFGFPVGNPDGVLGSKSRSAISNYQSHMGFPATGKLADVEKQGLFAYFDQAVKGGAATSQQASALPDGSRGLLKLFRDQAAATVAPSVAAPVVAATSASTMSEPEPAAASGALPTFGVQAAAPVMTSYCASITDKVLSAGGPITLKNMAAPKDILDQQFCLTRAEAVRQSDELVAKVTGMTEAQMIDQCAAYIPFFSAEILAVSTDPMESVLAGSKAIVAKSGQSSDALESTAKTCVGLGYKTDNPEMVLSASLLLASIGSLPYAEVVGHHLQLGFGTTQRPDLAGQWYASAIDSIAKGQVPAFAPAQTDRIQLLSYAIGGAGAGKPFALPAATQAGQ